MSLDDSKGTSYLDPQGQFTLALDIMDITPPCSGNDSLLLDELSNHSERPQPATSDSLWVSMSNGEQLHLRHFLPSNTADNAEPAERVFMLHGEAECGRIFYGDSGQGLAGYLVSLGYEVFVADLGGRGRSLGAPGRASELTTHQIITDAIPRLLRTIERHNNDTDAQDTASTVSNKATIWVAHGFGGVLLSAAWARLPESQRSASRMIFFGSRRRFRSSHRWARHFAKVFTHPMMAKLINWHQAFPAKLLKLGSSDESPDWYRCYAKWMSENQWLDPEDNFDYGSALAAHPVPPTLHFAAKADTVFADIEDIRFFINELGTHDARILVLGDIAETKKQYNHLSMLIHPAAISDVFSSLNEWLLEQSEKSFSLPKNDTGICQSDDRPVSDVQFPQSDPLNVQLAEDSLTQEQEQEQEDITLCA